MVRVASLRGLDRYTRPPLMRTFDPEVTALAQRRETHRQTGRGRGAHDEVSVAEGLVRKRVESDRLRGLLRGNCLSHSWRCVVVCVTGLVVIHRAVARRQW